ncbi:DUF4148 domain-containing protein [Duganella sp. LX20W]|uniref:DUF4148 domain-containing protein n=1 Tax=Rugamonas brunnea TaxID=2758569 RepID=A0A7W2IBD7_9BURK|nr:DUF4148 domain-containing protein [Rugamonas brunnea]MBA5637093.1 DUF4148 domain-containing protein [Rugamonas brunnea]
MNAKQRITAALTIAAAFAATGAYAQAESSTAKQVTAAAAVAAAPAAQANTAAAAAVTTARPAATGLTRAQVIAELLEARKNGTIPETEADFDVAQTRKHYAK